IEAHESLPELLDRLRAVPNRAVILEIPDHSALLLTASEFRTLKEITDQSRITLSLDTDDPLRGQLASMLGLKTLVRKPSETDGWRPEPTALGSSKAFGTWKSRVKDDEAKKPIDASRMPASTGLDGTATSPSSTRPTRRRLGSTAPGAADLPGGAAGEETVSALDYLDEPEPFWNPRTIARIVAALLVLALIGGAAGWYFMPSVTVTARLKETSLSTSFVYTVAAEGATAPSDAVFSLPATQGSATVPFTITTPATGKKAVPLDTASGKVVLRNPGSAAVKVPAGTRLANHADIGYTTTAEVEVPAANGDGPGETTVEVKAEQAGSVGNQPQGYLTGKIDALGVFFSNRDAAIEGGTDSETTVVAQADIDKLESELNANLPKAAAAGWESTLTDGQNIVAQSVRPETPQYTVQQKAGDATDTVTLQGTVAVTGLIYRKADVEAKSKEVAAQQMAPTVPQGYGLVASSIALGEPEVLAEAADSIQYRVSATGIAQATFDQAAQDALRTQIAGKGWDEAQQIAAGNPALASVTFSHAPGWWPQGMPQADSRITVTVDPSLSSTANAPAGSPEASPTPGAGAGT
ncbi:MAG TPA: baseplate J/gp47 family protein, partial [Thermomicrobiales bacterium]|nr:baseplate J/gp47 family protein [Thermomicrobiales bacterium]